MKERRFLLVTGTPRSGTLSAALALRAMGLEMGHEHMDRDGSVSSLLAFPSRDAGRSTLGTHPEGGLNRFDFDRVAVLVRSPLAVIASLESLPSPSLHRFVDQELLLEEGGEDFRALMGSRLQRAVLMWLGWWAKLERQWIPDAVIRAEDLPRSLAPIAHWTSRPLPLAASEHAHRMQHRRIGWADLEAELPPPVVEAVRKRAAEQGYL